MQNSRKYSFISDIWTDHFRQITLERKYLWDIIKIDWGEVFVTLNGTIVQLPISAKFPFRDRYRLRHLIKNRSL